jgi:hypothetical protein
MRTSAVSTPGAVDSRICSAPKTSDEPIAPVLVGRTDMDSKTPWSEVQRRDTAASPTYRPSVWASHNELGPVE